MTLRASAHGWLVLLHHAGVLHGSGRRFGSECVADELVDVGGALDRSEEQRLQHSAVDAEQSVKCQQQSRVAQLLRRMRSLDQVLEALTSFRVDDVCHITALQRGGTLTQSHTTAGVAGPSLFEVKVMDQCSRSREEYVAKPLN